MSLGSKPPRARQAQPQNGTSGAPPKGRTQVEIAFVVDAYRVTDEGQQELLVIQVGIESRRSGDSSAWSLYFSCYGQPNDGHY